MTQIANVTHGYVINARIRLALAALSGMILTVSACSSEAAESPSPSPSTSPSAEPSTPVTLAPEDLEDPHEAAVAAFERFMDAFVAASSVPDPASPELATAATGDALQAVTGALQTNLDQGERSEGRPDILTVTVTDSALDTDPIQVAIESCQDTT